MYCQASLVASARLSGRAASSRRRFRSRLALGSSGDTGMRSRTSPSSAGVNGAACAGLGDSATAAASAAINQEGKRITLQYDARLEVDSKNLTRRRKGAK